MAIKINPQGRKYVIVEWTTCEWPNGNNLGFPFANSHDNSFCVCVMEDGGIQAVVLDWSPKSCRLRAQFGDGNELMKFCILHPPPTHTHTRARTHTHTHTHTRTHARTYTYTHTSSPDRRYHDHIVIFGTH